MDKAVWPWAVQLGADRNFRVFLNQLTVMVACCGIYYFGHDLFTIALLPSQTSRADAYIELPEK